MAESLGVIIWQSRAGEQAELRALSTRVDITATRFTNEYHWGDFGGDPRMMMERYFDAHLYVANWGTRNLMIRLPERFLDLETAQRYCPTDAASACAARFPRHPQPVLRR